MYGFILTSAFYDAGVFVHEDKIKGDSRPCFKYNLEDGENVC